MSNTAVTSINVEGMMNLAQASVGCEFRIIRLKGEGGLCSKLRARGFCEEMRVSKLKCGRNMVCGVCGTRMALSKELAQCIEGELVA